MRIALLLLLVGCFHGVALPPVRAGDRNARAVRSLEPFASRIRWEQSPYYRPDDFGWPWYVIVANDGTACALFNNPVNLPNANDYFVCPSAWRTARP